MDAKSDKNEESSGSGNEVTAEWIVRAQLKITQPKKKAASFGTGDCGARRNSGSPCRVVYKWNSNAKSSSEKATESGSKTPTQMPKINKESDANSQTCKSTCSIVLTTDMCPAKMLENSQKGCTTHTYTFSPDQTKVFHDCETHGQQLSISKDASCQTSDCELTPRKGKESPSAAEGRRKVYADHRRATESLVSSEGRLLTPSRAATLPRQSSPALSNLSPRSKDKKKPPRTVHIDVYCTGSEVETSNSETSSSPNIVDDFTNLMAQASVIETDNMLLKHQRIVGKDKLPRKLASEQKASEPKEQLFDFSQVLNTGNDKDEVNESKQMLFKKYLGDQRQIQKFKELRSVLNFRRDFSDDAISSNYPNSSYSTMRDLTSSSLASVNPASPFEDSEMTWKELDVAIKAGNFITPAESFKKWDKCEELQKMKQFERLWSQHDEPTRDLLSQTRLMENFMFVNKQKVDSELSESDQSFNYQKSNELGNISDSSPSTVISYSQKKLFKRSSPVKTTPDIRSMSSSLKSGSYSKDHLALARRFGSVIKTMRKPGHHIGPVRNPACLCETCKRWTLERDQVQGRDRAFSFGDTPITKSSFWRRNNRNYV